MGLLDDAIREHLELKRRRGADAEEVTRQEQEALGAPQRGEFAGAAPAATAEPDAVEDAPVEDTPAPDPEPEPVPEREPEPDIPLDQATVEYAPPPPDEPEEREVPPAPPQEGDEDVLEETPDFLQETPEHDRLWFEQKPPRDFDLDR
jgi:hypothetical protein